MPALIIQAKTDVAWIKNITDVPIVGGLFLFVLVFVPAVLLSFLAQAVVPWLASDVGFTYAMYILLPLYNMVLWLLHVRVYIFFIPSWLLLGIISILKGVFHVL